MTIRAMRFAALNALSRLACLLAPSAAQAVTWRVPGDVSTIGEAVVKAGARDVIELVSANPYRERLDLSKEAKGITLRAAAGTTVTFLGDRI